MLPGVTAAEICSNWGRLTKGEIKYVNDKASLRSPPYRRMKAHATQSRLECGAASGTFEAERQRSCYHMWRSKSVSPQTHGANMQRGTKRDANTRSNCKAVWTTAARHWSIPSGNRRLREKRCSRRPLACEAAPNSVKVGFFADYPRGSIRVGLSECRFIARSAVASTRGKYIPFR